MDTPVLVAEERKQKHLILIVDRENRFGNILASHVYQDATVVLVTKEAPKDVGNIVYVPFASTIPQIPDGSYSHIFFIWDTQNETLELLHPLVQKAYAENSRFLFITDYHAYEESLREKIFQPGVVAAIALTGDIFDDPDATKRLPQLFYGARKSSAIALPEMGLEPLYLVSWDDTIKSLLRVGLGAQKGKILFAFPKHSHTMLTLAHALQKAEPLLKIDFTSSSPGEPFKELPTGEVLVEEKGQLKEVERAFGLFLHAALLPEEKEHKKIEKIETYVPLPIAAAPKRKRKWKWSLLIVTAIALFLLPICVAVLSLLSGFFLLNQARIAATGGNFGNAYTYAHAGSSFFSVAQGAEMPLGITLQFIGQKGASIRVAQNISNAVIVAQSFTYTAQAAQSFQKAQTAVLSDSLFHDGVNSLKNALLTFSRIDTTSPGILYKNQLTTAKRVATLLGDTVDVLPDLLGSQKKKSYLILFQNNMELRPSGGFIGSYATVNVEKGIAKDFHIHDVYDADGQLRGHVEPPFAIRRYIPLVHWYMRDSGFDVDFAKSAANTAFFLKQETGEQVDGVIGIDLSFIKVLLSAVGPVYVPEYKETVTVDNFFLLTEKHAEKNFFAGSTQKKDFLNAFFLAFQNKLFEKKSSPFLLSEALLSSLSEKHVLIAVADPSIQNVFTVNGFSSTLWDGRRKEENALFDFLGFNEANLGVNKTNYFISRTVAQNVTISPTGTVSAKLTLSYTNTSDGVWPGGDYKNYLRFILPLNAVLRGVTLNGQSQQLTAAVTDPLVYESSKFKLPIGFEVEKVNEEGKTLYGFLTTVPHQKTMTVAITYDYEQKLDTSKPSFTYSQKIFKQPGVDGYPLSFVLNFPSNFKLLNAPVGIKIGEGSLSEQQQVTVDTQKDFRFSQL